MQFSTSPPRQVCPNAEKSTRCYTLKHDAHTFAKHAILYLSTQSACEKASTGIFNWVAWNRCGSHQPYAYCTQQEVKNSFSVHSRIHRMRRRRPATHRVVVGSGSALTSASLSKRQRRSLFSIDCALRTRYARLPIICLFTCSRSTLDNRPEGGSAGQLDAWANILCSNSAFTQHSNARRNHTHLFDDVSLTKFLCGNGTSQPIGGAFRKSGMESEVYVRCIEPFARIRPTPEEFVLIKALVYTNAGMFVLSCACSPGARFKLATSSLSQCDPLGFNCPDDTVDTAVSLWFCINSACS